MLIQLVKPPVFSPSTGLGWRGPVDLRCSGVFETGTAAGLGPGWFFGGVGDDKLSSTWLFYVTIYDKVYYMIIEDDKLSSTGFKKQQ